MGEVVQDAERVRVVVRIRPPNEREVHETSPHHSLSVDSEEGQVFVRKKRSEHEVERELRYGYDRVFDEKASQADVFNYLRDGIQQVAQGFNCTVFAYGQTGTGKSHTMLGGDLEHDLVKATTTLETPECSASWGVIPRAIESLFDELQSIGHHGSAGVVHCSYMQIYKNDVYDLLQDNKQRMKAPLMVREMIKGNEKQTYVSGLSEFRVTSLQETLQLLKMGNWNRTIRATTYNEKSSRSHALMQLSIEVESRGMESATTIIRRAKLNLIDLAGSEKWDTDVVMGTHRSKELASINQSLSALGNVISALVDPKRTHIPYRDSKLTRLLQDSLGGNTRTVVIATISPCESAIDETISTLQFADRAKRVTVRVKVNELVDDAVLLAQAQREISRLKLLVKQSNASHPMLGLQGKVAKLTKEKAALVAENQKLRSAVAKLRKLSSGVATGSQGKAVSRAMVTKEPRESTLGIEHALESPSSSLQLEQLRLDLTILGTESKATSQIATAFVHDTKNAATNQELILQEIQTERRELERQLDRLSGSGNKQGSKSLDGKREEDLNRSEEFCPVCKLLIDDHSDAELDYCIELEMNIGQQEHVTTESSLDPNNVEKELVRQRPSTQTGTMSLAQTDECCIRTISCSSALNRRVSTSAHGKVSPYLLNNASKSLSVSQTTRPSAHVDDAMNKSAEALPQEASSIAEEHNANMSVNNQTSTLSSIPILRQGHKGLKALKKFRAASPYNNAAVLRKEKRLASPKAKQTSSCGDNGHSTTTIANSVRDIGLELSVYKFRYDCWYNCTIVGFDRKRQMHCCQYECGDKQWQNLSGHKVKVIGTSSATT